MSTWPWTRHAFPCSDIGIIFCCCSYADKCIVCVCVCVCVFFSFWYHRLENCIISWSCTMCLLRRRHLHEIIPTEPHKYSIFSLRIWQSFECIFIFKNIENMQLQFTPQSTIIFMLRKWFVSKCLGFPRHLFNCIFLAAFTSFE